jgi:hypothetical protein
MTTLRPQTYRVQCRCHIDTGVTWVMHLHHSRYIRRLALREHDYQETTVRYCVFYLVYSRSFFLLAQTGAQVPLRHTGISRSNLVFRLVIRLGSDAVVRVIGSSSMLWSGAVTTREGIPAMVELMSTVVHLFCWI